MSRARTGVLGTVGRGLLAGAAGGAAGTTALNATTYLDMALRGRGTSSAPEDTVTTLAEKAGIAIPGDQESRSNRIAGMGPYSACSPASVSAPRSGWPEPSGGVRPSRWLGCCPVQPRWPAVTCR